MGMKQATKDKMITAFERGFRAGEQVGYDRALADSSVLSEAQTKQDTAKQEFLDSLNAEPEPGE